MKKILLSFCCIILTFSGVSFADDDDLEEITWQEIEEIRQVSGEITDEPVISSRYGIVIERSSRKNFVCKKRRYKMCYGIDHQCNQLPKMTIETKTKNGYNTAFYPVEYNAKFFVRI